LTHTTRTQGYKWKANSAYLVDAKKKKQKGAADPCSHWYPGARPFQAPEVNSMANYFETLPRARAYVDLRTYGQLRASFPPRSPVAPHDAFANARRAPVSTPYSYSCKRYPKDAEDQMEAISGAAAAVRRAHGTAIKTGTLCSTLYRAPGNAVDWMYARLGVKWAFAAHLRDTGTVRRPRLL
jgi:hypothetical protein